MQLQKIRSLKIYIDKLEGQESFCVIPDQVQRPQTRRLDGVSLSQKPIGSRVNVQV